MSLDIQSIDIAAVDMQSVDISVADVVSFWTTPTDIPAAEAAALKAFYEATGGAGWTDNTGWGTDTTADNWTGVTVSGGHVTALELPDNNLIGDAAATLPTTIETLDLGQNTGLTDIDLSGLTSADDIDLAGCDFGQAVVSGILGDIVTAGVSGGVLDIGGSNSAPEPDGVGYLHDLEDDSWTLTYSTVVMENTGDMYAIFADGDATIRSANLDLSGQTDKYIVLTDSAGKHATAYGHAADDAEALGPDLMSGWDFTSGWDVFGTGSITDADTIASTADGGVIQLEFLTLGALYSMHAAGATSGPGLFKFGAQDQSAYVSGSFDITYKKNPRTSSVFYLTHSSAGSTTDISILETFGYTALGTDALQLRNAETGSTRNFEEVETGFNYNSIAKIEVFNG